VLGAGTAGVDRSGGSLRLRLSSGEDVGVDAVLFAAGRAGNTEELGLAGAGVAVDGRGRIVVDETYRSSVEGVFAAGDVIGPPALASVSAEQGRVAACHAFGIPFKQTVDPLPPFGVYSIPEVGMVGMTEEQAVEAGIDYETGRTRFEDNARSRITGATQGLLKLVFDAADRRLLGVHILSDDASELVHHGQAVLQAHGTIDWFIQSTYTMPSRTEAYKYAAYDALQRLGRRPDAGPLEAGPCSL
jgi:NAD(P) transhydrogenase